MADWLDGVRALLPGARVELVEQLGGSQRSQVRRVRADGRTVIVKQFAGSGDGWVREAAALSVLPPRAPVPRLIAENTAPPIVIMTDEGSRGSVADALLGNDRAAAASAVIAWAEAIARLHQATTGMRQAFRDALAQRAGDLPVADSAVADDLDSAAGVVEEHCGTLGVEVPGGALAQLRSLADRLGADGPAALTPTDACPDNNIWTDSGDLVLIDFEGAQWRHVAWDVAYLTAPWPTCWCSWRIPAEVGERAIEAYESVFPLPQGFRSEIEAARTGWAFISTSWFLRQALVEGVRPAKQDLPAPSRRAMVLHRLAQASGTGDDLAVLAARLHAALTERWGPVPLAYAPAFRGAGG